MADGRFRMHGGASTGPRTAESLAQARRADRKHELYSAVTLAEQKRVRDSCPKSRALEADGRGLNWRRHGAWVHLRFLSHGTVAGNRRRIFIPSPQTNGNRRQEQLTEESATILAGSGRLAGYRRDESEGRFTWF